MIQIWSPEKVYEHIKNPKNKLSNGIYCAKNFRWNELLTRQTEIPSFDVLKNLFKIALIIQGYRDNIFKGSPITITSGWRSPFYNKKIGGAPNSYHIRGMALDFIVKGYSPDTVQKSLNTVHKGGLEFAPTWTHIDIREKVIRFNHKGNVY